MVTVEQVLEQMKTLGWTVNGPTVPAKAPEGFSLFGPWKEFNSDMTPNGKWAVSANWNGSKFDKALYRNEWVRFTLDDEITDVIERIKAAMAKAQDEVANATPEIITMDLEKVKQ